VCLALVGCGPRDAYTAEEFSVKACRDTPSEASLPAESDNDESWTPPTLDSDDDGGWSADETELDELKSIRSKVALNASEASAAAQLDSSFRTLAEALTNMYSTLDIIIGLRVNRQTPTNDEWMRERLREYNVQLARYKVECNAVSLLQNPDR
jgi:hypothetical protein